MNREFSIFAAAADASEHPALIVEGRQLTFGELARQVAIVITQLERRGIARNEAAFARGPLPVADIAAVGLVASNQLPTLLMIYALLELAVPVALIHPRLTSGERRALFTEVRVRQVLAADSLEQSELTPLIESSISAAPPVDPEAPLAIVFTSGTSGKSRAALLGRSAFSHAVRASAHNLGWHDRDRWLLCLPVCHVGGLSIVLRCLAARKTVVLAHDQAASEPLDLDRVVKAIDRDRVTLLSLVPTVLQRLLDSEIALPVHVRAVLLGGAGSSVGLLARAADRGWPLLTTYGLTESCSQVTTQPYGSSNRGELGSGKPVLGTQVRIASNGVIEIKSRSLFSGYLEGNQLDLPLDHDGWFCTSDLGRFDEAGYLHVLGRSSELIVTGGENVYPSEVERVLESCPGVAAACVFGIDDPRWGQVVAAVVVGAGDLQSTLKAFLDQELAPHKRPRLWAKATELPQTAIGKLDRLAAARRYAGILRPVG